MSADEKRDIIMQQAQSGETDAHNAETAQPEQIAGDFLIVKPEIKFKIKDYDGPIGLLYDLIKKAEIPIEEVFISDITSQYIQILKETPNEELDYDFAGEFIVMAAELVYIKSLSVLPPAEDEYADEEYFDVEEEKQRLINKIKEYALMKEQSEKLREVETINRFYRSPTYTEKDYRVALVNFSLPRLVEAFARVLVTADTREQSIIPKKVMKDRFSVHEQMENICSIIAIRREMDFADLFESDYDKSDIVTTFLAVLELLKYGRLHAKQEEMFGEIIIYAVEGTENMPIVFEEGDDGKY